MRERDARVPAGTGTTAARDIESQHGYGAPGIMKSCAETEGCYAAARGDARGLRHRVYATGLPSWARYREFIPGKGKAPAPGNSE